MDERHLRNVLDDVRAGRLSRRAFLESMLGLGLTAPLVAQMFAAVDVASAQPKPAFSPTKRGGGGLLKTLWWQAPTLPTRTSRPAPRTSTRVGSSTTPSRATTP